MDEREYNRELLDRCLEDAKEKHYLRGVPKAELFEGDRKAGVPLPANALECSRIVVRKTDRCGIIQFECSRYSVSDRHARKNVIVRYGAFDVDIYDMTGEHICHHRRSYKPGSITIDPTMYAEALAARPRARIRRSDNEYTDDILNMMAHEVGSVRPAARGDAIVEFFERQDIQIMPVTASNGRHSELYGVIPYSEDKEHYDWENTVKRSRGANA